MKVLIRDGKQVEEADDVLKQTALFKAIATDAARYSITPTTFETREYEKDLDCWYHVEHYHTGSHATRFGFNNKSTVLLGTISKECKTIDISTRPSSTVKSAKYTPKDASLISLCSIEQNLIDMVIEHMVKFGERAVVVDILARMNGSGNNGFVKLQDSNTPEIHSVVLYMNPTSQALSQASSSAVTPQIISVIDPSNFLFSAHLSNYEPQISGTTYEIKTFHKSTQIYKPSGAGTWA